ncbi:hypothetical protein [Infirmifilum sp. SLHALR2]
MKPWLRIFLEQLKTPAVLAILFSLALAAATGIADSAKNDPYPIPK